MNHTVQHIKYLLEECNSVAVPGLGVFRVVHRPALFSDDGTIIPPGADVLFDPSAFYEDDRLISSVMRGRKITSAEAVELISNDVEAIRIVLDAGADYELPGLGVLSIVRRTGEIRFKQNNRFISAGALQWLAPVDLEPLETETKETIDKEAETHRDAFALSIRRTASSAAAIAMLILITFISAHIPRLSTSDTHTLAALPVETASSTLLPAEEAVELQSQPVEAPLVLIFNTPSDATAAPTPRRAIPLIDNARPYCLVVASFNSRRDADKFIDEKKPELSMDVLEKDGLFRVFIATGESVDALRNTAVKNDLYETYPNAWICRR